MCYPIPYVIPMKNHRALQKAFTLLEMSIVVLIVALVAGGIVIGDTLIETAEIRRFVTQIENYKTAVSAFKIKYDALPGDMKAADAATVGLATRNGGLGRGDGSGILLASNSGWQPNQCGEINLFWNDLATAGLVDGGFKGVDSLYGPCFSGTTSAIQFIPQAKIGDQNVITVYGDANVGRNFFITLGKVDGISNFGYYYYGTSGSIGNTFTPFQALNVDTKIDDGKPLTGLVTARIYYNQNVLSNSLPTAAAPALGVCVSNATDNPYNIDKTLGGNYLACNLRMPID